MGFWSNWWDDVRLAAWTRGNSSSSRGDSEAAREKILRKARKEISSAFHIGLTECCSKAVEELEIQGFATDEAAKPVQQAISQNFVRTLPNAWLGMQGVYTGEIEEILGIPAREHWQKFYRWYCTGITKQEKEIKKEIKQLKDLIRYWQYNAEHEQ
jgi:hypothetical protein